MTNAEFAEGLRELAAIYEANPELKQPPISRLWIFVYDIAELPELLRAFGGRVEKKYVGGDLELHLATKLPVAINIARDQVCTKRIVGTKTIPAQLIPEHTEEIVEWDCHPVLEAVGVEVTK